MSEYQYYEFRTIDRALTKTQRDELREISTRATTTAHSFVNVYNYGDFGGDPPVLMGSYFDAFVYVSNFGDRRLMFKLPLRLLDSSLVAPYAGEGGEYESGVKAYERGEQMILDISAIQEEGTGWEEGEGWLDSLLPLRGDIASGDLRTLYIGWLAQVQWGYLENDVVEPPVPAGLRALSPALKSLVEYLWLEEDLVAVAAERSDPLPKSVHETESSDGELEKWVRELPQSEKDELLLRLVGGEEVHLHTEMQRRYREVKNPMASGPTAREGERTVLELLDAAERHAETRKREEAEATRTERARREKEEAELRAVYLGGLDGREEELWRRVEELVETKQQKEYDQAAQLVTDLRDLSLRTQKVDAFEERLSGLRERHAKKRTLIDRLTRVGVRAAQ
jgi:hypothetical protein